VVYRTVHRQGKGSAGESGGTFQPLEKDVILNVVLAALHSHQDLAAHQSTNRLLHDADARGRLAQAFAELAAHRRQLTVKVCAAELLVACVLSPPYEAVTL
jgi:hypothetical protein